MKKPTPKDVKEFREKAIKHWNGVSKMISKRYRKSEKMKDLGKIRFD